MFKEINVYEKPDGKVIRQMKNNSINEDFLHLEIISENRTHFHVKIYYAIENDSVIGWTKKGHM